jgi:hypothetical protein
MTVAFLLALSPAERPVQWATTQSNLGAVYIELPAAQLPQMDRVTSLQRSRQKKNRLLDVWRQIQHVHDLADAGTAHVAQLGQGQVIDDLAGAKVLVETQRQRHQARNAWNAPQGRARLLETRIDRATRTVATADDVKVHLATECLAKRAFDAMMKMKKIDIAAIEPARRG